MVIGSMLAGGDSIETPRYCGPVRRNRCSAREGTLDDRDMAARAQVVQRRELDAVSRSCSRGCGPQEPARPILRRPADDRSGLHHVAVHGRAKQGAAFGYTEVRGNNPQLAGDLCADRAGADEPAARRTGRRRPRCSVVPHRDDRPSPRGGRDRAADRAGGLGVLLRDRSVDGSRVRRAVLRYRPRGQAGPRRHRAIPQQAWQLIPYWLSSPEGRRHRRRPDRLHRLRRRQALCPHRASGRPPGPADPQLAARAVHRLGLPRVRHRPRRRRARDRGGHRRHAVVEQRIAELNGAGLAHLPRATSWPTLPGSPSRSWPTTSAGPSAGSPVPTSRMRPRRPYAARSSSCHARPADPQRTTPTPATTLEMAARTAAITTART
jgi:hypothetical protein